MGVSSTEDTAKKTYGATATADAFWRRTALPLLISLAAGWAVMSLSADVAAWLSAGHVLCCVLFLLLLLSIGRALWFAGRRGADVPVDSSGERRSQFTIRQLIFAVFFTSLLCAAARWLGGECVAVLALWLPGSWPLWTAIAHPDQAAARLLALHLVLAIYLTFGPILAYHVNGRAWYDYGLAGWNPPVSQDDTGKTWKADYDPKFTPPATWPIVGPAMYAMSYFSPILVVCPPTAPLVAMVSLFLLWRAPVRRTRFLILSWAIGCLPIVYLLVWGLKVLDWIAD